VKDKKKKIENYKCFLTFVFECGALSFLRLWLHLGTSAARKEMLSNCTDILSMRHLDTSEERTHFQRNARTVAVWPAADKAR
jgi:hypothetical protein